MSAPDPYENRSGSLAAVVGVNTRRIRLEGGVTLDQLARLGQELGYAWTTARINDFEAGRHALTLETFLGLALALEMAVERPVTLAELIADDSFLELSPTLGVWADGVAETFRGVPLESASLHASIVTSLAEMDRWSKAMSDPRLPPIDWEGRQDARGELPRPSLADTRAAQAVGVSPELFVIISDHLWAMRLEDARDALAKERSRDGRVSAQARGRVTRELVDEVRKYLETAGKHGDD